jgi:hypothetical protein
MSWLLKFPKLKELNRLLPACAIALVALRSGCAHVRARYSLVLQKKFSAPFLSLDRGLYLRFCLSGFELQSIKYSQPNFLVWIIFFWTALDMAKDLEENKAAIVKLASEKILAQVPYANGFHFFVSIGRYPGETAISLKHFASEIEFVPIESIEFHFKRGDSQKWIASTIGDRELAEAIGRIKAGLSGELLRKRIS